MRCWVSTREEYHVGHSLAWYLLEDGSWLVAVVGWGLRHEPADAGLLTILERDDAWEELVRFSLQPR